MYRSQSTTAIDNCGHESLSCHHSFPKIIVVSPDEPRGQSVEHSHSERRKSMFQLPMRTDFVPGDVDQQSRSGESIHRSLTMDDGQYRQLNASNKRKMFALASRKGTLPMKGNDISSTKVNNHVTTSSDQDLNKTYDVTVANSLKREGYSFDDQKMSSRTINIVKNNIAGSKLAPGDMRREISPSSSDMEQPKRTKALILKVNRKLKSRKKRDIIRTKLSNITDVSHSEISHSDECHVTKQILYKSNSDNLNQTNLQIRNKDSDAKRRHSFHAQTESAPTVFDPDDLLNKNDVIDYMSNATSIRQ